MKLLTVLLQLIIIYGFFVLGELVQVLFSIPLPGSIIGFLLLFIALLLKLFPLRFIESGATSLLSVLPLFFIPATVGVIEYLDLFAGKGAFLIVILIFSTLLTMAGSGLTSQYIGRKTISGKERE